MLQLESEYSAEATQGPLICDITYPMDAPGFVYDPTGSIQKDAFKNGKQVLFPLRRSHLCAKRIHVFAPQMWQSTPPSHRQMTSSGETCLVHILWTGRFIEPAPMRPVTWLNRAFYTYIVLVSMLCFAD